MHPNAAGGAEFDGADDAAVHFTSASPPPAFAAMQDTLSLAASSCAKVTGASVPDVPVSTMAVLSRALEVFSRAQLREVVVPVAKVLVCLAANESNAHGSCVLSRCVSPPPPPPRAALCLCGQRLLTSSCECLKGGGVHVHVCVCVCVCMDACVCVCVRACGYP